MTVNCVAKNASNFLKLNAAFFIVKVERGISAKQLHSLLDKLSDSKEFELITIEGEEGTAFGLIDMEWFKKKFDYDPDPIDYYVQGVIDGIVEHNKDNVYLLNGDSIYIANPDVY
ncbi:MAG: hypothetical protein K2G70_04680 [Turicibacter sp.]|nr:hypothetical protein [Turicibacter sp.]